MDAWQLFLADRQGRQLAQFYWFTQLKREGDERA